MCLCVCVFCVCIHARTYIDTRICTYTYIPTHDRAYTYACSFISAHTTQYTYIHTNKHSPLSFPQSQHPCMHMCTNTQHDTFTHQQTQHTPSTGSRHRSIHCRHQNCNTNPATTGQNVEKRAHLGCWNWRPSLLAYIACYGWAGGRGAATQVLGVNVCVYIHTMVCICVHGVCIRGLDTDVYAWLLLMHTHIHACVYREEIWRMIDAYDCLQRWASVKSLPYVFYVCMYVCIIDRRCSKNDWYVWLFVALSFCGKASIYVCM
jgi:hypothetical protein